MYQKLVPNLMIKIERERESKRPPLNFLLKPVFSVLFLVLLFLFIFPLQSYAYTTNMNASVEIGQTNFTNNLTNNDHINDKGYNYVFGVDTDGIRLFVSDDANNRILIYNSIPTSNNASADVVIGQQDMNSGDTNQGGGPGANTLNSPGYMSTDGIRLFVADESNSRVLIYNHIPTSNNTPADIVIGQPNMQSNQDNQGGSVDANTLADPAGVFYDPVTGKLIITDNGNSRVLIYNSVPTSNNASADVVIGQPDMQSSNYNQGGSVDGNTLTTDDNARIIQGKLIIPDSGNNRVLIYNSIPTTNNASADVVIGQPDLQSSNSNQGGSPDANTLSNPKDVIWDGSHLLIEEIGNNRILIYNSIPTTNNASADVVIGQPDFVSGSPNQAGNPEANTLSDPEGQMAITGGKLFIGDSTNNRVLVYNSVPTSNNASADVVIGQPDFTASNENGTQVPNSSGLDFPIGVLSDGNRLFVADCRNHRLLIYNSIPTSNNASADVVIGQPDMQSKEQNQGGGPDANTLNCPEGIATDGTKLFVTDSSNNRLLIYNHIPTTNNASADVVIGQPDMQSNQYNQGGSVDANTLNCLDGIFYDSPTGKLFLTDDCNSRVLIWNSVPTINNTPADVVVGQADFTHGDSNQGGSPDANTLNSPVSVTVSGGKLIVADDTNNRILIYNHIPITNNASADVVIGQPDFTHNDVNQGENPDANTMQQAAGVTSDGTRLFAIDDINHRLLIFNQIPTTNNASADVVIGQPDFTSNFANQGGNPAANTLNNPYIGIIFINNQLIVSDSSNNRVLIYNDDNVTPIPTPTPTPIPANQNNSSSSTTSNSSTSAPTCSDQAPTSTPDLFQIDTSGTKATVYFAPAGMPYDNYVIRYGPTTNNLLYSASFTRGFAPGVIYYTINELNPNTIYYFQVRAGNGCKPGEWGNVLSAKTTGSIKSTSKSYKSLGGFIKSLLSSLSPKYTGPAIKTPTPTPTTVVNNTPGQCTQYTVLRGDSFWTIAQKLLGSGQRYLEIRQANTNTYPTLKNSPVIRAGWKLSVGC